MPASDRKLRFSFLLMGILFAIIATIVLAGIWASYETSRSHLVENADLLRGLTEAHINRPFHLVDTGLKHYDSTYNDEMEDAFVLVMEEYRRAGGEPAAMDLAGLRSRTGMDVFVIDDTNTVVYTTKSTTSGSTSGPSTPTSAPTSTGSGTSPGSSPTGSPRTGAPDG